MRAIATEISGENRREQKLFPFFKIIKKTKKWKSFLRVFSQISLRITSTPHLAKPMLYAVPFYNFIHFTNSLRVVEFGMFVNALII